MKEEDKSKSEKIIIDRSTKFFSQVRISFWDTAAAAYLGKPSLFSTSSEKININVDEYDFTNFGCITQGAGYSVNIALQLQFQISTPT